MLTAQGIAVAAASETRLRGSTEGKSPVRQDAHDTILNTLLALELASEELNHMRELTLIERDAWDARINAQREARNG